jgi:hypothetical protein
MSSPSVKALLSAIVTKLRAASPVTALVGSGNIYTNPPEDQLLQYIQVFFAGSEFDTKGSDGLDATIDVVGFTDSRGPKLSAEIADAVTNALHDQTLTLGAGGGTLICCHRERTHILQDPDGLGYQSRVTFRVLVGE